MSGENRTMTEGRPRRRWNPPALKPVGTVGDVLKGGNGKVTVVVGDPGEPQKVPAHES